MHLQSLGCFDQYTAIEIEIGTRINCQCVVCVCVTSQTSSVVSTLSIHSRDSALAATTRQEIKSLTASFTGIRLTAPSRPQTAGSHRASSDGSGISRRSKARLRQ